MAEMKTEITIARHFIDHFIKQHLNNEAAAVRFYVGAPFAEPA